MATTVKTVAVNGSNGFQVVEGDEGKISMCFDVDPVVHEWVSGVLKASPQASASTVIEAAVCYLASVMTPNEVGTAIIAKMAESMSLLYPEEGELVEDIDLESVA